MRMRSSSSSLHPPARLPPHMPVVQCAANFSEGRRPEIVRTIAKAASGHGAIVADYSADADHNRMVLSLLGSPAAVREAVLAAAAVALHHVDLRYHDGAHPRMGVVDVVPFTPIRNTTMQDCIVLAEETARALADNMQVPVYLYERAAREGRPSTLPAIRRAVRASGYAPPQCGLLEPDLRASFHPSRGAAVVGARPPLVAYNIYMVRGGLPAARMAARAIRTARHRDAAVAGVRALGLLLPSQESAQVSMNITQPFRTPVAGVFAFVADVVQSAGGEVGDGELIGLAPQQALMGLTVGGRGLERMRPSQVLEYWLEPSASDNSVYEVQ